MAKQMLYGEEARKALMSGIDQLADTVKIDKEGLENYSNMLPIGTYYVQETKATDGYVLSDKVYKVVYIRVQCQAYN